MVAEDCAAPLAGLRLLIAEDDGLIGLQLEDQLAEAGCEIAGFATSLERALDLAAAIAVDGAVLDINLGGEMVYAAAKVLEARGIPFLFLTGYEPLNIPASFRRWPVVQKPFAFDDVTAILRTWRR